MDGVWVPIILFLVVGAALIAQSYFRFRARQELQLTLRESMSSGQSLAPEFVEQLLESLNPPGADLRRGLISLAIAGGLLIFALVLGEADAIGPLTGLSAFPFLVGLSYLLIWWLKKNDKLE